MIPTQYSSHQPHHTPCGTFQQGLLIVGLSSTAKSVRIDQYKSTTCRSNTVHSTLFSLLLRLLTVLMSNNNCTSSGHETTRPSTQCSARSASRSEVCKGAFFGLSNEQEKHCWPLVRWLPIIFAAKFLTTTVILTVLLFTLT